MATRAQLLYVRSVILSFSARRNQAGLGDIRSKAAVGETLGVGDFVITTFPGELTVQIGLNIKQASPHPLTFVAGYTNGYLYYAPTSDQLANAGGA